MTTMPELRVCTDCGRVLLPAGSPLVSKVKPAHYAKGMCKRCYQRSAWKWGTKLRRRNDFTGKPCLTCGRILHTPKQTLDRVAGSVEHVAGGLCVGCYSRQRRQKQKLTTKHRLCVTCNVPLTAANGRPASVNKDRLECNRCYYEYLLEELDFFLNTISYPVRKIAERLGYSDAGHFNRLMRQHGAKGSSVATDYLRAWQAAYDRDNPPGSWSYISDKERNRRNKERAA